MLGLLIRLGLVMAVTFGVVIAVLRARRARHAPHAIRQIQRDIEALRVGLEEGLYTDAEYRVLADRVTETCEREGIEVPELPPHIEPKKEA